MRKHEDSRTSLSDFVATFTNCPGLSGAGRGQRNPMQISKAIILLSYMEMGLNSNREVVSRNKQNLGSGEVFKGK